MTKFKFPSENLHITWYMLGIYTLFFFLGLINDNIWNFIILNPQNVSYRGQWWTLMTYTLVHPSITYFVFAMVSLYFSGSILEQAMGSIQFLIFYLASTFIVGFLGYLGLNFFATNNTINFIYGSSGAIYACLVAFACFYPHSPILLYGIFPIRAAYLILGFAVLDFFLSLGNSANSAGYISTILGILTGIGIMEFVYKKSFIEALRPR